jgi:hypothetical protein
MKAAFAGVISGILICTGAALVEALIAAVAGLRPDVVVAVCAALPAPYALHLGAGERAALVSRLAVARVVQAAGALYLLGLAGLPVLP